MQAITENPENGKVPTDRIFALVDPKLATSIGGSTAGFTKVEMIAGQHPVIKNQIVPDTLTVPEKVPGTGHSVLSADFFSPWVIQRTGFVDFYGADYPLPPIPRRPIEYTFCGRENWMTRGAAWHGSHVYTLPLSLDARAFVLCDFSKRTIAK